MYTSALFGGEEPRNIHMGIDVLGPERTEVCAFADGVVAFSGYNPAELDYGHGARPATAPVRPAG